MSASTVITEGFGTFGSNNFVVTQGFGDYGGAAAPAPAPVVQPSGGTLHKPKREPVFADYGTMRERLRLEQPEAVEVIENVAMRQVEDLGRDDLQRLEELERELALQNIVWKRQYLELLNLRHQQLIDAEIGERLKLLQNNNDRITLLLFSQL